MFANNNAVGNVVDDFTFMLIDKININSFSLKNYQRYLILSMYLFVYLFIYLDTNNTGLKVPGPY